MTLLGATRAWYVCTWLLAAQRASLRALLAAHLAAVAAAAATLGGAAVLGVPVDAMFYINLP